MADVYNGQVGGVQASFKYTGSTDLSRGARVIYDATDGLALAGATDDDLGAVLNRVETGAGATGPLTTTVNLRGGGGIIPFIASEAVTAPDELFKAASGKVATTGTEAVGIALSDAAADGDIVYVQVDGRWQ